MAIPNYIRPQLTIEQILQTTPTATRDRLTAVVIGRQYLLNLYGQQDNVYSVDFTTAGFTGGTTAGIALKTWDTTTESYIALDTDVFSVTSSDVSLYISSGEATLFSSTASATLGRGLWSVKSAAYPNVITLGSTAGKLTSSNTAEIYSGFSGRKVAVGDVFYVKGTTADTGFRRRTVTAVTAQEATLSGPIVAESFFTNVTATLSATASGAAALTVSSTAGLYANMPVVSISGTASFSDYTYISSIAGGTVTLNQGVTASSGATVSFGNVLGALEVAAPVTQVIPTTEWDLDTTNDQVTVVADAEVSVAGRSSPLCPLRDGKGSVYVSYKALRSVADTEGLVLIETPTDIEEKLGVISLENEIAYGANEALSGAQGKAIYALRTSADTTPAYAAALKKIEATDAVYALAPLTDSSLVKQLVATHCESMSVKTIKNFRRCYIGTDSPGEYSVLTRASDGTTKLNLDVTVMSEASIYADLTNDPTVNLLTLGLTTGDLIKVINSNGEYTGDEFVIDEVTDNNSMVLSQGPLVSGSFYVEFWKADTSDSQLQYVINESKALNSRRAVNVWVENATRAIDGVNTVIPNKYVAAEIAGLRTAVVAWQGLTMTEISAVTDAPAMYTRYNSSQLNEAASNGVLIVTQEAESGAMFIRHQLTTRTSDGSLAYEDSVGTSLDFISFQIKDALSSFIGRKNVTEQTLLEIYDTCWEILNAATKTSFSASYGPQLNGFQNAAGDANKIDVAVHPTLKDRVSVYAKLLMPLPLNNIDVVLDATVDFAL